MGKMCVNRSELTCSRRASTRDGSSATGVTARSAKIALHGSHDVCPAQLPRHGLLSVRLLLEKDRVVGVNHHTVLHDRARRRQRIDELGGWILGA